MGPTQTPKQWELGFLSSRIKWLQHKADNMFPTNTQGHAIAQAVSRRLPTVAAQVRSCGICGGQSGTGAGFLRVLWFPLPILIPPTAPYSSSPIIWGWYNRPTVADIPSGLSLTSHQLIHIQNTWRFISKPYICLHLGTGPIIPFALNIMTPNVTCKDYYE
jgi:hypothetical protein